jgi:hypothetical protein
MVRGSLSGRWAMWTGCLRGSSWVGAAVEDGPPLPRPLLPRRVERRNGWGSGSGWARLCPAGPTADCWSGDPRSVMTCGGSGDPRSGFWPGSRNTSFGRRTR